tara:strand:- start:636 stop:1190 length:555 start_codon:yes stop_codon:yes gene_type:complete
MILYTENECVISRDLEVLENATKLILPGVGSFDNGMALLKKFGLIDVLNKKVLKDKTPILGICLGMQLMASSSEEGVLGGLGWIDAKVKKFDFSDHEKITIPVIGWSFVDVLSKEQKILKENQRFYFVHSYYYPKETKESIASVTLGFEYCVAFKKENILGVQFHPEKSHKFGYSLLKKFCELC